MELQLMIRAGNNYIIVPQNCSWPQAIRSFITNYAFGDGDKTGNFTKLRGHVPSVLSANDNYELEFYVCMKAF